jgi:ketosteroid isomerase-like protein
MSEDHAEAVRRSIDGWNRRDFEAFMEAAHPEVEWVSEIAERVDGREEPYRGREGMRRYWDEWQAIWDVTIEITETIDLGDTLVVLASLRTRGEASGIGLERPIAYVFEFEDGLVRRARAYFDQQRALEAAGLGGKRVP